ncbi:MAG TPA: sugar transferase [Nocardioidaceae bacterium]|nr:sugar transferase [Nocardioidaceae bacterium]
MVALPVERDSATEVPAPARIRRQLAWVIGAVSVLDALVITLSTFLALSLKFGFGNTSPTEVDWLTGIPLIDFGWMVPVWVGALVIQDAYSRRQFARGTDEFKTVLKGSLVAAAAISMVAYLVNYDMSRGFYLLAFVIGTALLLVERGVVRTYVRRQRAQARLMHRVVVAGSDVSVAELERVLSKNPGLGYQLVGACGVGEDPVEACRLVDADTLIVTGGSLSSSQELRRIGWELDDTSIDLIVVPSLMDVAGPRIHTRPVAGLPLMHIEPPQVARAMKWGKAFFDRLGSLLLILVLSPIFVGVALAVRLESGGPVFYRHRRIGLRGHEFGVWKFRSMVVDADQRQQELRAQCDADVVLFKLKDDPRVTRVGRFIRRYSLDELPQLFNVLLGDMSLVGPRPQVAEEVAAYDDSAHRRLLVRPGITGLWQVSGRSHLTWEESVRLDLSYVDNWSMMGDIVILAKTVRAVLRHDGAY